MPLVDRPPGPYGETAMGFGPNSFIGPKAQTVQVIVTDQPSEDASPSRARFSGESEIIEREGALTEGSR